MTNKPFEDEVADNIKGLTADVALQQQSLAWNLATAHHRYTYNFQFLGRPIIQFPQDMIAVQEIIWAVRPDLVIETGIAHGGSLMLSAGLLALLDMSDAAANGSPYDPRLPRRKVLGIDIEIRAANRHAIEHHPLASRIEMIEGSSVAPEVVAAVQSRAQSFSNIMVFLDSSHTHDHVLAELDAYAPLVAPGSYCVVFDTIVADSPKSMFPDRPWGPGNNPKTAVHEFLSSHPEFAIDSTIPDKLLITVAPDGYLKRLAVSARQSISVIS